MATNNITEISCRGPEAFLVATSCDIIPPGSSTTIGTCRYIIPIATCHEDVVIKLRDALLLDSKLIDTNTTLGKVVNESVLSSLKPDGKQLRKEWDNYMSILKNRGDSVGNSELHKIEVMYTRAVLKKVCKMIFDNRDVSVVPTTGSSGGNVISIDSSRPPLKKISSKVTWKLKDHPRGTAVLMYNTNKLVDFSTRLATLRENLKNCLNDGNKNGDVCAKDFNKELENVGRVGYGRG